MIVGLLVYVIQNYLHQRTALHHYGGVLWNGNSELFCPKDETPLFQNGVTYNEEFPNAKGVEIFECPKCERTYIFKDNEGSHISLADAKKGFLLSRTLKTKKKVAPSSTTTDGFDKKTLLILKMAGETLDPSYFATDTLVPKFMDLKPVEISYRLDILLGKGLIESAYMEMTKTKNKCYRLSEKGRAYIVQNGLV